MIRQSIADEAIRHFIGLFHIAEERSMMRIDYDRLAAAKAAQELGPVEALDHGDLHPYRPGDHIPEIPYSFPGWGADGTFGQPGYSSLDPEVADDAGGLVAPVMRLSGDAFPLRDGHGHNPLQPPGTPPGTPTKPVPGDPPSGPGTPSEPPEWTLPVPDSIAVIAVQKVWLTDDDHVDAAEMKGGIVADDLLHARLETLVAAAEALSLPLAIDLPEDEPAFVKIAEAFRLAEGTDADSGTDLAGSPATVETHLKTAAEVEGRHLNGETVAERPDYDALMPQYRLDKIAEAEAEAAANAAPPPQEGPVSAVPGAASGMGATEGGHDVITGNNTLTNQVTITAAMLSAPVIAAGAGVYSYNVISQVNVWSDADLVLGLDGALGGGAAPTQALNYASVEIMSSPSGAGGADGDAPQYWATAVLEGSFIAMNWIEQFNLMSDGDITSITIHALQTLYLMGENNSLNKVSLNELGASFDVIVIDGYVINLNAISQTNVLLDDDRIMVSDGVGGWISAGDNLLINDATIIQSGMSNIVKTTPAHDAMLANAAQGQISLPQQVLEDQALAGLDVVRVLHVKGDLVSLNVVRQTNVLGDADQIEIYRDDLLAGGGEIKVIAGSNVLVNAATIAEFGVDATIYTGGEIYSDALLHQAELISNADPLLPQGQGLASEAVLFLAEGMLGEDAADAEFQPIGLNAATPADAMETVLS